MISTTASEIAAGLCAMLGAVLGTVTYQWWKERKERRRDVRNEEPQQTVIWGGTPVKLPRNPTIRYHPDGVPIGLRPGDPVTSDNMAAIIDFVEHATRQGEGETGDV